MTDPLIRPFYHQLSGKDRSCPGTRMIRGRAVIIRKRPTAIMKNPTTVKGLIIKRLVPAIAIAHGK
jgi:hypothetical protein